MLFLISVTILAVYVALSLKAPHLRWIGWALAALNFLVIVLLGSALQAWTRMEAESQTFFMFLAVMYSVPPIILGHIAAKIIKSQIPRKKRQVL